MCNFLYIVLGSRYENRICLLEFNLCLVSGCLVLFDFANEVVAQRDVK